MDTKSSDNSDCAIPKKEVLNNGAAIRNTLYLRMRDSQVKLVILRKGGENGLRKKKCVPVSVISVCFG